MGKTRDDELYEQGMKLGKEGSKPLPPIVDGIFNGMEKTVARVLFGKDGAEQARRENDIVRKGIEEGYKQHESSSSSSSDSSSSSSSLCYLTTACVNARGLPDNCLELNVLRKFRNRILLQNPIGKEAVKEYYQIAPEIVQEINRKNNHPQEVWNSLYKEIKTAVDLVLSGDFNEAFKHYQEMTLNLKRTYLTKTKS